MKNRMSFPIVSLAVVLVLALAVCRVVKAFVPFCILPQLNIPNIVLLCGVSLLLDHLLSKKAADFCFCMPILAAAAFALLPFAAGFAVAGELLKLALVGGVAYGLTAWVYHSIAERIATGPKAVAAPVLSILGLYLAAQCFQSILL